MDLSKTSCCLITKEDVYPREILASLMYYPFGEMLILTHSDSPYRKYELFEKAKHGTLYYQDDDAICNVQDLVDNYKPGVFNILMDPPKIEQYKNRRMTMGFGWGALFERSILHDPLLEYKRLYGEDELLRRDAEKILTHIVYPQNRIASYHQDLPSAMAPDRLWQEPQHWSNMDLIENKCARIIIK
jgi:hypothetical protein